MGEIRELNSFERDWLIALMKIKFKGKDIVKKQIENAKVISTYERGYISLKFILDKINELFPYRIRVPFEVHVKQEGHVPIVILLHIFQGKVNELEIFNADSSEIDKKFVIDEYDAVINDELIVSE